MLKDADCYNENTKQAGLGCFAIQIFNSINPNDEMISLCAMTAVSS